MISRHYHQTTLISEERARSLEIKAETQENKILSFIKKFGMTGISAEDIQSEAGLPPRTPITSIRRALTNLKRAGKIRRIGEVEGQYGQPIGVYVWVSN